MLQKVRFGIVGLGPRGRHFLDLYQSHPGLVPTAVCDLSAARLDKLRETFGDSISYYTSVDEMVADKNVDAVIVATNDPDHVEPTITTLNAGKHVLVEKPLCQSLDDAEKMIEAVRNSQAIFQMGFELREATVFKLMKRLIDEGRIGEIKIGHCFDNVSVGGDYFYHDPAKQKAFFKSLLLQKATHSLDLLNWFVGSSPIKVYATGGLDFYGNREDAGYRCSECDQTYDCPYAIIQGQITMDYGAVVSKPDFCVWSKAMDLNDNSELSITYANGVKATFHECHFTPDYSREFWFTGTKGKMYGYYDNPGRFLVRIQYSHAPESLVEEWKPEAGPGAHGGGDVALRDEFYRRIVENDPDPDVLNSAYYSTALAICAEESIESGMPVMIPQV